MEERRASYTESDQGIIIAACPYLWAVGGSMNLSDRKVLTINRKVPHLSFVVYWRHYGR